ncbi:MAG: cell division protein FtsA [Holosporales bacterium]
MAFLKVGKRITNTGPSVLAGLDIGSSKVCCTIARLDGAGRPHVAGIGFQATRGLRGGTIVDMEALEDSVAAAVNAAEDMADETIRGVYVAISPSVVESMTLDVENPISGHPVDEADVKKMLAQAYQAARDSGSTVVHTIPVGYAIDGARGIRDPRGMFGERLGATILAVRAQFSPLRNIAACIERCHLEVAGFVVSSYASGLGVLVEDELDLGVTLLDMGAGVTSISLFYDGKLHHVDHVPVGGLHVTHDLARGLSTPLVQAERIKTLYGSAMAVQRDERDKIAVPQIGEEEDSKGTTVTRAELVRIIRPRIEETFELVRDKLKQLEADKVVGRRLVLTGGASQLAGVRELAAVILDKQARLGKPLGFKSMDVKLRNPAFATSVGLIQFAAQERERLVSFDNDNQQQQVGLFSRLGSWVRENL